MRPAIPFFAIACSAGLFLSTAAAEKKTDSARHNAVVNAVQKTKKGIVAVSVPRPGGERDLVATGVIVDERGYIITNRHFVGTAREVKVRLADGKDEKARVVVADTEWDLAILRVQGNMTLQPLPLVTADDLMVGESVIVVGHPYGYDYSVSTGIISAVNRRIRMPTGDFFDGLIQTNASVNPGNSGGPVLNIHGEWIGVILAFRDGAQGIGFALPAKKVHEFLQKHLSAERLSGVSHGLRFEANTGDEDTRTAVVLASSAGASTQAGDVVVAVDNRQVVNAFDVERALWDKTPGQKVELKIVRKGREITVPLTLAGRGQERATGSSVTNATPTAREATRREPN